MKLRASVIAGCQLGFTKIIDLTIKFPINNQEAWEKIQSMAPWHLPLCVGPAFWPRVIDKVPERAGLVM